MGYPYMAGYSPYQQVMPYQMPQSTSQDGFIHVQSEGQARSWDVMPGQSRTFINDNAPYCYTKSMPVSQLEPLIFKRFRLVEEPDSPQNAPQQPTEPQGIDLSEYITKAEFEPFKTLLQRIKKELYSDEPTYKQEAAEPERAGA